MKTLYETIFDQEAGLDTIKSTRALDDAMRALNPTQPPKYIIDLRKNVLTITSIDSYWTFHKHEFKDVIVELKKLGVDHIDFQNTAKFEVPLNLYEELEGFTIISVCPLELIDDDDVDSKQKIKNLKVIVRDNDLVIYTEKGKTPVFENCEFECRKLYLGYNSDPRWAKASPPVIKNNCKIKADLLVVTNKRSVLNKLLYGCEWDNGEFVGYRFGTDPFRFCPVPVDLIKNVPEVRIRGLRHKDTNVIIFSNNEKILDEEKMYSYLGQGGFPVEKTNLTECPWKYVKINVHHPKLRRR